MNKAMKVILIILGILVGAFLIIQFFALRSQHNIETYSYEKVKAYDGFEIRNYEASLFTSVKLSTGEYKQASSTGFSILAGYIFGGNATNEKIAMTSPVAMSLEDSMTMMFMVPREMKKENLPRPNASQIQFREEPAKTVAALSFGGWANTEKLEKYKKKLKAVLDAEGIAYEDRFYFLGYNAPYEFFNRKNEVIVELKDS
jgi:hypothetical protein